MTTGWTLQDFHNNMSNSEARKEAMISMEVTHADGAKEMVSRPVIVSKVLADTSAMYTDLRSKKGAMAYFTEMLQNHVFHVETGEPIFKRVDIMSLGYPTVEQFIREKVPLDVLLQYVNAINEFSGLRTRQEDIDEIKNL